MIELRSDTHTRPTEGMRQAMYRAEVGDDGYGEDPSVNHLEGMAAGLTGKEAALFVNGGTMGNLIPLFLLGGRGNEALMDSLSHIIQHEAGGVAALAGMLPRPIKTKRGILTPENLTPYLHDWDYEMSDPSLITIENTHNFKGGTCYTQAELEALYRFSRENNLKIHTDGARLFNAAAATGMSLSLLASYTDSLTFCLSKGLGCPFGALIAGEKEFIEKARRLRRMLGGSYRQAGIMAAAGVYALENHVALIPQDHEKARIIAMALAEADWAGINADEVETNIIFFDTRSPASEVAEALKQAGINCLNVGESRVRMVTSMALTMEEAEEAAQIIRGLDIQ